MEKQAAKERIEKLKKLIDHQRYLYHVLDKEDLSPEALDSLKHELFLLEQKFPELITPDSPTQRVEGKPLEKFAKVEHKVPMISLEDAFAEEELFEWEKYLRKLQPGKEFEYFCELKVDGFAVSLVYKNGIFFQGSTRGDGKTGEDVTANLKTIESIPLKLEPHNEKNLNAAERAAAAMAVLKGEIEVRGEVYLEKSEFEKANKEREKNNLPIYANPRNLASGSIRQLDPKLAASRHLSFRAYDIIGDFGQATHSQEHKIARALGFQSDEGHIAGNLREVISYCRKIKEKREKLPFLIDGVVININNNALFLDLGVAGKAPRGARAFKFAAQQATTIIESIGVQVGRTGTITPVANLKPVEIGGTMVKRATLHNADQIERLGVKIGDSVVVERAGDVIPAVTKVLKELRGGKEKDFKMPEHCPVCKTKLIKPEGEVAWRCPNENCFARQHRGLYHFVSKSGFDIAGLGREILDQLIEEGLIKQPQDIFKIKKEDLIGLERFGEKSAENIVSAVEKSKEIKLDKFINALGIRHVGENTAVDLAYYFKNIDHLAKASQSDLEQIPDIGPKMSQSILEWFGSKKNIEFIEDLRKQGIRISAPKRVESKISGKIFAITGTLDSMEREEAKAKIISLGGEVCESVGKKTSYLVAGKNPGSKMAKARSLGVKILDEKEFLDILK